MSALQEAANKWGCADVLSDGKREGWKFPEDDPVGEIWKKYGIQIFKVPVHDLEELRQLMNTPVGTAIKTTTQDGFTTIELDNGITLRGPGC